MNICRQLLSWTLVLLFGLSAQTVIAQDESEIDMLQDRLWDRYFQAANPTLVMQVRSVLGNDGSFSGLNYSSNSLEAFQTHLDRVNLMVRGYFSGQMAGDPGLLDDIGSALGWWLEEDYIDPNWWWTYIGFPGRLIPITSVIAEDLREPFPDVYENLINYHTRVYNYSQTNSHGGGANMTDMGYRALIGAIMDRDVEQIETVIEDTFDRALILMGRSNNWDGWRIDGSIYGHGPQLHNATYGREMSLSTVNATSLLYDSPWDLGRDVIDQLEHAILNGLLRMSWGEWFDFNAAGRGVSRPGSRSFAAGYIIIIEDLLELNPSQPEKLEMVLDRILDGPTPEQGFSSTQSYVYSDFITHIRPDYYSSIRMISNRTKRNEGALNNEGMKNLYFGDGIQFTVVHGDEYANLPPVWNYARLPGLTARQESNLTPPPVLGERGSAVFANSLTDGRTGLAGMRLQHRDTRGWKTWFAVKEGIVALGSGIQVTSGTANEEVLTTVNQTLYGGEARLGTAMNGEEALEGSFSLTSDEAAWAWNRDIGYLIFGDNDDLTVQAESVTGDWSDVGASSGSVTNDVFTLYFDHGIQPSNAGYSYMVLPTASSRQTQAYASEMPVEILRKDGGVHAIRHRKTGAVYIVFLQADSLVVDDSLTVESNGKALVQLVPHLGSWKVLVADPEFNREAAIVSLHNGDVVEELSVDLPDGDHVGMPATAYAWNSTAPMRSIESESPFSGPWKQAGFGPYLPTDDAWIYHGRLGWVQTVTDADENIYLHPAEEDDWYWTRAELAGWAYHFENKEWVRLN